MSTSAATKASRARRPASAARLDPPRASPVGARLAELPRNVRGTRGIVRELPATCDTGDPGAGDPASPTASGASSVRPIGAGDEASTPTASPRIGLFIDLENADRHSARFHAPISVERIYQALRGDGEIIDAWGFADMYGGRFDLLRDVDRWGVELVQCFRRREDAGLTDTVDERMKRRILRSLDQFDVIAIATNDTGFRDVMLEAKRRQRFVILLVSDEDASAELQRLADKTYFVGSRFLLDVARCADRIRTLDVDALEREFVNIATTFAHPVHALVELIQAAGRIGGGFSPTFLRDRAFGRPGGHLHAIAIPEEGLPCIDFLRQLGCFVPDEEKWNHLVVGREHPFVRIALRVQCAPDGNGLSLDVEAEE